MSKPSIMVVAAIIFKKGNVLICRRKAGKAHAGFWEFPGGKIELNESKQGALYREIKEELGIEITIKDFFARSEYSYSSFTIDLWAFRCEYSSGAIKLSDHDKFAWVDTSKLLDFELSHADIEVAQKLVEK